MMIKSYKEEKMLYLTFKLAGFEERRLCFEWMMMENKIKEFLRTLLYIFFQIIFIANERWRRREKLFFYDHHSNNSGIFTSCKYYFSIEKLFVCNNFSCQSVRGNAYRKIFNNIIMKRQHLFDIKLLILKIVGKLLFNG